MIEYVVLVATGLVAGTLNVVAGGGSFLTLPALIFLGLPPTTANGTNRVGVLFQNVGAVWGFDRHRVLDWRSALVAAAPATVGAALGVWLALLVGDAAFRRILALLMVVVTLSTLLGLSGPGGQGESSTAAPAGDRGVPPPDADAGFASIRGWKGVGLVAAFFAAGIYGGFIQAGVGFLLLAVTSLGGLDLVRGNAVKVVCVLAFTILSLALFAGQGLVSWLPGLALGVGTAVGGQVGVRLTTLKGHRWVRAVVTVTVILFALRLWFGG